MRPSDSGARRCGQASELQRHPPAALCHSTRRFPSSCTACGRSSCSCASTATGYQLRFQSKGGAPAAAGDGAVAVAAAGLLSEVGGPGGGSSVTCKAPSRRTRQGGERKGGWGGSCRQHPWGSDQLLPLWGLFRSTHGSASAESRMSTTVSHMSHVVRHISHANTHHKQSHVSHMSHVMSHANAHRIVTIVTRVKSCVSQIM